MSTPQRYRKRPVVVEAPCKPEIFADTYDVEVPCA